MSFPPRSNIAEKTLGATRAQPDGGTAGVEFSFGAASLAPGATADAGGRALGAAEAGAVGARADVARGAGAQLIVHASASPAKRTERMQRVYSKLKGLSSGRGNARRAAAETFAKARVLCR